MLSLAIKYPIRNFEHKFLHDLKELQGKLEVEESKVYEGVKSSLNNKEITHEEALFYSYSKISGSSQRVYVTYDEMISNDNHFNLNPLIYYRVSQPVKDLSVLPTIDLSKLYDRAGGEDQIKFSVKEISIKSADFGNLYGDLISSPEKRQLFSDLVNVTKE